GALYSPMRHSFPTRRSSDLFSHIIRIDGFYASDIVAADRSLSNVTRHAQGVSVHRAEGELDVLARVGPDVEGQLAQRAVLDGAVQQFLCVDLGGVGNAGQLFGELIDLLLDLQP